MDNIVSRIQAALGIGSYDTSSPLLTHVVGPSSE
jgi:hypothetical protein